MPWTLDNDDIVNSKEEEEEDDIDMDLDMGDDVRRFSVMNLDTGELIDIEGMEYDMSGIGTPVAAAPAVTQSACPAPQGDAPFEAGERVAARIVNRAVVNDPSRSKKSHTVYVVSIWRELRPSTPWFVYRRYSDFLELYERLRKIGLVMTAFPGKKVLGLFDANFLDKRQGALNHWLDNVIATYSALSPEDRSKVDEVRIFLCKGANQKPQGFNGGKDEEELPAAPAAAASSAGTAAASAAASASSAAARSSKPKLTLKDFELLKVIGKGSFGQVLLARKRGSKDRVFAVKVLNKSFIARRKQVEHTKTERRVLGYTRHPNVVSLHYAFQSRTRLYFVLDYCAGGELFFHLGRLGRFPEDMTCFYTAQLVLALGHLHSLKVVYRDLKPENVLLDAAGNIKIADFGLSKENVSASTHGTQSFCGTPEYLAPEILDRKGHGTAVDWWSLGMLVYEMLTGLPPWYTRDRRVLYESIRSAALEVPDYVSPKAHSLLKGLLNRDPAKRLGGGPRDSADIMEHPFFSGIDWNKLVRLELQPSFLPKVSGKTDTRNFEKEFTTMPVSDVVSESVGGSFVGPSFNDFTFHSPSEMSMYGRGRGDSTLDAKMTAESPPRAAMARGAGAGAGAAMAPAAQGSNRTVSAAIAIQR